MNERREFLKFMGRTTAALSVTPWLLQTGCATNSGDLFAGSRPFTPLAPSHRDELGLVKGLSYEPLIKFNEPINDSEFFGANNDFLAFHPLAGKTDEGILLVNHEYLHPVLFHSRKMDRAFTRDEVVLQQKAVGNSLLHIQKTKGRWQVVKNSKYNRRITGQTPIPFDQGYTIMGARQAMGTLANCAGGQTPWGTFLTCEENYDIFYGEVEYENHQRRFVEINKFRWYDHFKNPPEHYGWVVEIEPTTGRAVKRNALGRFEHEAAKVVTGPSGRTVVYMGEDRKFGYIYKFISSVPKSLSQGTLYVADTVNGRWIALDRKKTPALAKAFKTQQDVLTYARHAAKIAGGTPQDRPEDVEIGPRSNDIFIALTNNDENQNPFGSILKITEKDGNFESLEFKAQTWLEGSPAKGFICPDNMVFDKKGNLWVTVDMPEKDVSSHKYPGLGHNGLYYVALEGPTAGVPLLVASAPTDAEFTGPMFSPDYKTLFLSVQHPGSETTDPQNPTSRWPDGPGHLPKSTVVMISGPLLEQLT